MAAKMDELLPYLFSNGITPTLSAAMQTITSHVPEVRSHVELEAHAHGKGIAHVVRMERLHPHAHVVRMAKT